jgi:competence transcription factor ComK
MGETTEDTGVYKMTSEQKAKLKNFGKKNGLSEQKVQTQLSPKPPVTVHPQIKTRTQPQIETQTTQQPLPQTQQRQVHQLNKECQTYFSFGDEESGCLDIDLITFREKGVETRYLSLMFSGLDVRQNPPVLQEAFLNIGSKEDFERIKAFFTQLEWED